MQITAILWIIWDVYMWLNGIPGDTESEVLKMAGYK